MNFEACPTLYEYPPAFQEEAAGELEALPEGSALAVMMGHYGANRAEIRACRGAS